MKIAAYETRADELGYFKEMAESLKIEIVHINEILCEQNADKAEGCLGVTVLGHSIVSAEVLDRLKELGVVCLSTRTIGYNHIDTEYAQKIGIRVSNSNYEPSGVADFTMMLMLMSIRHYKQALFRGNINDYSINGLQGRELKNLTVGVLGSGKIGSTVIDYLKGFGSRVLVYDAYPNEQVRQKAQYVDLETIYQECDIITLHTPLLSDTYHMINRESICKMKDGVVLINCARGELMDVEAVIEGIETQKIGAVGLDVIENEEGIYHQNLSTEIVSNRQMAYLRQFPNVTMTQHIAFYTDAAVRSMVASGVSGLIDFITTGACKYEVRY